jgi:peptide subunit release factor 1 (eRF1)
VIVADTQSARLFSIALGSIELRREIRAAQAARGDGAIESDRHADDTVRKHVRLAAQSLEELANEVHASWILIGGEPGIAAEIEGALGAPAQERVLGRASWDIRISENDLSSAVADLVDTRAKSIRRVRAEDLVKTAPHEGALLGLGPVIRALAQAKVATLLLSESFPADTPGWACRACRAFESGPVVPTCPVCGKPEVQAIALREELGSQAMAQGADVHFVESGAVPGFDAAGGVGAYTRYP